MKMEKGRGPKGFVRGRVGVTMVEWGANIDRSLIVFFDVPSFKLGIAYLERWPLEDYS